MIAPGRIAALILISLALGAGLWLLAGRSAPPDPERSAAAADHLRRGHDLYRQGLYRSAEAELMRAKREGLRSADLEYGLAQLDVMPASEQPSEEIRRANRRRRQAAT